MTELINSRAEITHLNLRKQGQDDNRVLAIDIKFTGARGTPDLLKHLLGLGDAEEIKAALWDDKGMPRFPGIGYITPLNIIEGCTVAFGGVTLEGCDARKFHITPGADHLIQIDFSASAVRPPEAAMRRIPNLINEEVPVSVTIKQLSLLDQATPEAESITISHDGKSVTLSPGALKRAAKAIGKKGDSKDAAD